MQRKVFRIEEMLAGSGGAPKESDAAFEHSDLAREIKALRALTEQRSRPADTADNIELAALREAIRNCRQEIVALIGVPGDSRASRASRELRAAAGGMESATEKILNAAESIDDIAKTFAAASKTDYERGLAQDMQDHVVAVYEASNFHDLAGQHIGNAIAALRAIEEHATRMLGICGGAGEDRKTASAEPKLVNGPKLDGDSGHATQSDIDRMFG